MSNRAIGVDLGGTKILTALVSDSGQVLSRELVATPQDGPQSVADAIVRTVRTVLDEDTGARLAGIGVGVPGPLDPETGVVFQPPNLHGWHNVPFAQMLSQQLNVPVYLENDANAAALGEWWAGAGQEISDLVYITVSTGVGGGIIIADRLVHGVSGTAGEVGHMTIEINGPRCVCGNTGCLEVLASGKAIARAAREAVAAGRATSILDLAGGDVEAITSKTVDDAAQRGDIVAREIFERAGFYIGVGVANLLNLLNPARVIIGGGVSRAGALLLEPIQRTARARAFERPARDAQIVLAGLGDDVGAVGAAAVAFLRTIGLRRQGTQG